MMDWETDLMRRHAEIICRKGGDVLNVGFGMGIVDGFIREHQVRRRRRSHADRGLQAHFIRAPAGAAWENLRLGPP